MTIAVKDGFVTAGGRRHHYLEAGEGPPFLLLHTGGASAHEYGHVIDALAAGGRVIAWDMPGHGDSDPLTCHHSIEDHCDALERFIDALGLRRIVLVGSSIGGYIAMDYARQPGHRLERAVIVEAPLRSPAWYKDNWTMFEAMCAIPESPPEAVAARFRDLTPEVFQRWTVDRHKAGARAIVDLAWAARDFDAAKAFAAGLVPTTVVLGAKGPTVAETSRLAELRPDARIEILKDCGHFPMIDDPQAFARAVLG